MHSSPFRMSVSIIIALPLFCKKHFHLQKGTGHFKKGTGHFKKGTGYFKKGTGYFKKQCHYDNIFPFLRSVHRVFHAQ